jgi:FAD/FMN-containing dehydrogenase
VLGVEAVLADGSVVSHLSGLVKDNTGYDLAGLLTGSEGTLGIVTAARLRLVPLRPPGVVVLVGCASVGGALALLPRAGVRAAEVMLDAGVELVRAVAGLPAPLARRWPVYLLLETDDTPDLPDDATPRSTRACGPTASGTPRPSPRSASRTSSTCPCRPPGWATWSTPSGLP